MKRLAISLFLMALLALGGSAVSPAKGMLAAVTSAAAQESAAVAPAPAQLDPSTRRAYRHVFIAFGVAWGLMLGYVYMLDRRYALVERARERERLEGR